MPCKTSPSGYDVPSDVLPAISVSMTALPQSNVDMPAGPGPEIGPASGDPPASGVVPLSGGFGLPPSSPPPDPPDPPLPPVPVVDPAVPVVLVVALEPPVAPVPVVSVVPPLPVVVGPAVVAPALLDVVVEP